MLLPEPLRPTTPKNSPFETWKPTSRKRVLHFAGATGRTDSVQYVPLQCPLLQVRQEEVFGDVLGLYRGLRVATHRSDLFGDERRPAAEKENEDHQCEDDRDAGSVAPTLWRTPATW